MDTRKSIAKEGTEREKAKRHSDDSPVSAIVYFDYTYYFFVIRNGVGVVVVFYLFLYVIFSTFGRAALCDGMRAMFKCINLFCSNRYRSFFPTFLIWHTDVSMVLPLSPHGDIGMHVFNVCLYIFGVNFSLFFDYRMSYAKQRTASKATIGYKANERVQTNTTKIENFSLILVT